MINNNLYRITFYNYVSLVKCLLNWADPISLQCLPCIFIKIIMDNHRIAQALHSAYSLYWVPAFVFSKLQGNIWEDGGNLNN